MAQIIFKLEKGEKEEIKNAGKKIGLGISPFCRSLILKKIREEAVQEAE